jgi:hypothetical protein
MMALAIQILTTARRSHCSMPSEYRLWGTPLVQHCEPDTTRRVRCHIYDTDHEICSAIFHTYAVQLDGNALICRGAN